MWINLYNFANAGVFWIGDSETSFEGNSPPVITQIHICFYSTSAG